MKTKLILCAAITLAVGTAYSQTPAGQPAPSTGTAGQPAGTPNQIDPGNAQRNRGVADLTVQQGRERVIVDVQNRPGFGGTNAPTFGGTNLPPGLTNQAQFANTNARFVGTNFGASANGAVLNDAAGATTNSVGLSGRNQSVVAAPGLNNQANVNADAAFTQRLQTALSRSGSTQIFFPSTKSNVTVANQNGTVTLTGFVGTEQERQSIETRVSTLPGITTINNQLQIAAGTSTVPGAPPAQPSTDNGDRRLLTP